MTQLWQMLSFRETKGTEKATKTAQHKAAKTRRRETCFVYRNNTQENPQRWPQKAQEQTHRNPRSGHKETPRSRRTTDLFAVGLHDGEAQGGGPLHRLIRLGNHPCTQGQPLHDVLGTVKHLMKTAQSDLPPNKQVVSSSAGEMLWIGPRLHNQSACIEIW